MTRVLVCRVGCAPVVEELEHDASRGYLNAMQEIVGGYVECITLDDGVDVWCNEDGPGQARPLNQCIPTVGRSIPHGFAFVIDTTDGGAPGPGEPAEWRIHGDFFLARGTPDGELASVTDQDIAKYAQLFGAEAA